MNLILKDLALLGTKPETKRDYGSPCLKVIYNLKN